METLIAIDERNRLIAGGEAQVLRLPFSSGLLIALYDSRNKRGWAGVYDLDRLTDDFFDAMARRANNAGSARIEVKLVGASREIERARPCLERSGFLIVAVKAITGPRPEWIYFYPAAHRVRLEKADAGTPAVKAAEPVETESVKARVLIVDDSPTVRKLLKTIFSRDPEIEVVGEVGNPLEAEGAIQKLKPNVVTLDIYMPEMDGVTLLKRLVPRYGLPTVMITSISMQESPLVLEALEHGAVDYVQKPSMEELPVVGPQIIEKVKTAVRSKIRVRSSVQHRSAPIGLASAIDSESFVFIGSSTGGTEALREVLTALPANIPPILIVQHIPPVFSKALAMRLNDLCPFEVKEAEDHDELLPGRVLIAPGAFQMRLKKTGSGQLRVVIEDTAPVNRHKPSVDALFLSVDPAIAKRSVGIILTGMGADGAQGLLALKKAGAATIAQDEASCVVYGMPREAVRAGAVDEVVSLKDIPARLVRMLSARRAA